MKKLSILFAALIATTMSFAATKTITLDFTKNTWGLPTKNYETTDATFTDATTGYTISFSGVNKGGYKWNSNQGSEALIFGKNSGATLTFNSFNKKITRVELIGSSGASGRVTWDFNVNSTKLDSKTGCKETYSFDIPVAQQSETNTFSVVLTNANNAQFTKAIFTYEEVSAEASISCSDVKFGTVKTTETNNKVVTVIGENLTDAIVATLQKGSNFSVTGTLTAEGGTLTIAVTATEAGAYKDTLILTAGSLVKKVEITANLIKIIGEGTEEKPYTIADVIALNNTQSTAAWIEGYIVGCVNYRTNKLDTIINTMVALADTKDITEETAFVPVALPNGSDIRSAINLVDNEENLGLKLAIKGDLIAYFNMPGLKNPTDYKLEEKSLTPATWYSQESISGTLDGKDVKYTITYEITRNADKTLTIKMGLNDEAAAVVGMVPQLFIAGAHAGDFNNGEFTTSATYTDGDVLEMWFYMAYAGGATASAHFNYTVGSSNNKPTALDATVVAPKATKRLINGVLVIEKDGVLYTAQGAKL